MSRIAFVYMLIVIILVTCLFNCAFRYYSVLKEKRMMEVALCVARDAICKLEREREKYLLQEQKLNQVLLEKRSLEADKELLQGKVDGLQGKVLAAEGTLGKINNEIIALKSQVNALEAERLDTTSQMLALKLSKEALEATLVVLSEEKSTLEAKLQSADELNKALASLRKSSKKRAHAKARPRRPELLEGNLGYVIREGTPTLTRKTMVEVLPADE